MCIRDRVKDGKDKAIIEGVFQVPSHHAVRSLLDEAGYTLEDDLLIVTREFSKEGKSVARINQRTTTTVSYTHLCGK